MILYLAILGATVLMYLVTIGTDLSRSKALLFVMMLGLGLFVGFSDMLGGYDRYIYANLFDSMCDDVKYGFPLANTALFTLYPTEFGYDFLNYAISFFTHNRYIFILIYTLIVYVLLYASFSRYVINYPFALVVFMGLWFFFTFTYLRQVLAAATCWLAIDYAVRRKPVQFFAIVILAITIHNSAIVFAPLYFVPIRKFSPVYVIVVMVVCLMVGLTSFAADLFENFGEVTDMEKRLAGVEDISAMAFRIEYLMEAVAFLTVILWRYDDIDEEDSQVVVLTNMAFVFCAILLLFVKSENGGRLGWYYMMGVIATLTYLANKEDRINLYGVGLGLVCAALYLRIVMAWGVLLSPYKTFMTSGHRDGDFIYEMYEYDERYDVDKLYR